MLVYVVLVSCGAGLSGVGVLSCRVVLVSCDAGICGVIIIIINHFYIALLSALEQTHCARM